MAWYDWLRRLVAPTRPRHQQRSHRDLERSHRLTSPVSRVTPVTPPVTPPAAPRNAPVNPTPVQTRAQPDATLVIRIVDTANHPLQPAFVLTGQLTAPVHFQLPQIPGYVLLKFTGFTQNFLSEYGLTTLIYEREWGQPIISYLIDYDAGQLLALPQVWRGRLGTPFQLTPPPVPGYHIFQAQGIQRGRYTRTAQRVMYFYRRDAWQTVQRVHQYLTLTADHPVYDQPAGTAHGYQFPAQSLWRIFAIVTLTDNSIWYNLGGEQWLSAQATQRHTHWTRILALPPKVTTWETKQALQTRGTVAYVPHEDVTIFREPYGEVAGQLANGEQLEIRQRLVDDQHLVWYQIGPAAYINARYVRLTPNR